MHSTLPKMLYQRPPGPETLKYQQRKFKYIYHYQKHWKKSPVCLSKETWFSDNLQKMVRYKLAAFVVKKRHHQTPQHSQGFDFSKLRKCALEVKNTVLIIGFRKSTVNTLIKYSMYKTDCEISTHINLLINLL